MTIALVTWAVVEETDIKDSSLQICSWEFRVEQGVDRAQLSMVQSKTRHIVQDR